MESDYIKEKARPLDDKEKGPGVKLNMILYSPDPEKFADAILDVDDPAFRRHMDARWAARAKTRQQKRRQAPGCEFYDRLRCLISGLNYGTKLPGQKRVHPKYTNKEIVRRFLYGIGKNKYKGFIKIPNVEFADHFAGLKTVYFLGRDRSQLTLGCIDLDAQKSLGLGSAAGCKAFAKWLNERFPGQLFAEVSPGGVGVHVYFILDKGNKWRSADEVNEVLHQFQTWLRYHAKDFDLEQVEVKGTVPILKRDGEIVETTSGQYCSLPRTMTLADLDGLRPIQFETLKYLKLTSQEKLHVPKRKSASCGSSVSDDDIETLRMLGTKWVAEFGEVRLETRHKITAETVKGYLLVAKIHKHTKLKIEQFGIKFAKTTWSNLYEAGILEQAWNPSRWKWIRDWFSAQGHNFWSDSTYFVASEPGEGQACVWEMSEECDRVLTALKTEYSQGGITVLHKNFTDLLPPGSMRFACPKRVYDTPLVAFIRYADAVIDDFTMAA